MEIPLFKIYWDKDDLSSVQNVISRGTYWTTGPDVNNFENLIGQYFNTKYCTTFNSGTSALHALLLAYGIKSGDEVIVPSFTFISTANAVQFVGAKPVFADIERQTYGLDPDSVSEKITDRTKAIIPVHYGGCPCKIQELKEIAEDHNLLLFEDAAESFGAKIGTKKVGTYGDAAILSFCQNKIITTGEGGAVITDSKEVHDKLHLIRSHGRVENGNYFASSEYFDYISLGYNFRMSDITAALGTSQLKKIDKIITMRRDKAELFIKKLREIPEISVSVPPESYYSVYQLFTIWVKGGSSVRDKLMGDLSRNKISAKVYFYPVHLTKYYETCYGYTEGLLPVTEEISNHVLTLPLYPDIDVKELDFIVQSIEGFFK